MDGGGEGPGDSTRTRRRSARRWLRRVAVAVAAVPLAAVLAVLGVNVAMTRAADGLGYDDPSAVPTRTVAIVFGAKVEADGSLSGALADRVHGAVELYRHGRVSHLLMTGDNSRPDYDEVTAMRDAAIAEGVPAAAITRDYAGFDTHDSCVRAVRIFGVHDAVLVTQDFHLARALHLCRHAGIDAVGLAIPDWQHRPEASPTRYPDDMALGLTAREWLARVKAFVDADVLQREPLLGGPYEGLRET